MKEEYWVVQCKYPYSKEWNDLYRTSSSNNGKDMLKKLRKDDTLTKDNQFRLVKRVDEVVG